MSFHCWYEYSLESFVLCSLFFGRAPFFTLRRAYCCIMYETAWQKPTCKLNYANGKLLRTAALFAATHEQILCTPPAAAPTTDCLLRVYSSARISWYHAYNTNTSSMIHFFFRDYSILTTYLHHVTRMYCYSSRGCVELYDLILCSHIYVQYAGVCMLWHGFFFFPIPFIIFALLFSLAPSRNSDPGSHGRLFFPPTHHGSCLCFFSREDFRSFLPSSTRVEWCLPTLGALSS